MTSAPKLIKLATELPVVPVALGTWHTYLCPLMAGSLPLFNSCTGLFNQVCTRRFISYYKSILGKIKI
jgi:hypothetical protein